VPNWTVVPTNTGCNGNISSLTEDLSHEMVELVSDPAGLGWIHESLAGRVTTPNGANFEEQYNEGELADICSSVGLFPTPSTDFNDVSVAELGMLSVAPYWSDQDAACEPRVMVDHTLAVVTGRPVRRFTASEHDLFLPLALPAGLGNLAISAIELMVVTGNDNLNSGSAANATVSFSVGSAAVNSGINEGTEWGSNTAHAVLLRFPHGLEAQQLLNVTLNTQFGGGISGDNWDVNAVAVKVGLGAPLSCIPQPAQVVNDTNTTLLSDGSFGLIRMSGSTHTLTVPINASPSLAGLAVDDLLLTVGTGKDDLRGGPSPSAFASVTIGLDLGAAVTFPNIDQSANWPSRTTHTVDLFDLNSLPAGTTLGSLSSLTLSTAFGGGPDGDNWDVTTLSLTAVMGCTTSTSNVKPITLILLQDDGATILPDGSIGLARLTGDVHTWGPTAIQGIPSNQASLQVIALQVTITTGDDDLHGGSDGGDNATVTIGGVGAFPDVNQTQNWANRSVHTVSLTPLPSFLQLGSIASISISTMFGGGINGDNWDIADVQLSATVLGPP
jgi:hypothetical protein